MKSHVGDVAFADSASKSLLELGILDERWVASFLALPDPSQTEDSAWPASYFRLRHFISMYLPLRYWTWVKFEKQRKPETEARLALVGTTVEEKLWAAACSARMPSGIEGELVRLVLGDRTPLRLSAADLGLWEEQYLAIVKELTPTWQGDQRWSRWTAMALHFASFYLDLALTRTSNEGDGAGNAMLKESLSCHVAPETVALVELWLKAIAAERDGGVLPAIGKSLEGSRRLKVRTPTEVLLLG